jgi:hypothetical protein
MRLSDLKTASAQLQTKITAGEVGTKQEKQDDARFWYPKLDGKKVGQGKMRFVPASETMYSDAGQGAVVLPWVILHEHKFKTTSGSWFWEKCPTTLGLDCPICTLNKELWATEVKANQDIVRGRSRKTTYFFNTLVLSDSTAPENVGKMKIFRSGKYIFNMLMDASKPKFEGLIPVDAFDLWKGSDFNLRIKEVDGNVNYSSSAFDAAPRPIAKEDEQTETIWKQAHDLREFVDPKLFKSPEELVEKFNRAIGKKPEAKAAPPSAPLPTQPEASSSQLKDQEVRTERAAPAASIPVASDSDMDYFESLVKD